MRLVVDMIKIHCTNVQNDQGINKKKAKEGKLKFK